MSYSSENIKTKLLEPVTYNNKYQAVFRITEPILTNMRLIDLGAHSSAATNFNIISGSKGIIRNMTLYSGETKLSGCSDSSDYQSFQNYNNKNSVNRNLDRITSLHGQGYQVSESKQIVNTPLTASNIDTVANDANLSKSWLSIGDFCPLLRNMSVLDPAMFGDNLRLEVEFHTDPQYWCQAVGTSYDITRPRLIVDCVYNYDPPSQNISWNEMESDRFTTKLLSKAATTNDVLTSQKLNAFNNKICSRMVMIKNYVDKAKNVVGGNVVGAGIHSSYALVREKQQIIVNGQELLPRQGCDTSAKRLSMINDTYGACNTVIGTQNLGNQAQRLGTPIQPLQGQLSYFGMNLNGVRVKEFVVNLTQTGVIDAAANTPSNDPLMVVVYMEVQKNLVFDGKGNYKLEYA